MTAVLRGKPVPTAPSVVLFICSFCTEEIRTLRGIVVEQGEVYCTGRCHQSAVDVGRHPR